MKYIDLTHKFSENISVYPGGKPPEISDALTIENDGSAEKRVCFYSHSGTHMDAPAHMIRMGRTLDDYRPEDFLGKALVIDVSHVGKRIGFEDLLPYGLWLDDVKFVFFRTGWSQYFGTAQYYTNYPVLTKKAANFLCERGIRCVGVDTLSVDSLDSDDYPIHHILLGCDMLIIENLTGLEKLPDKAFDVFCLPLSIENADGAPVRVIAKVEAWTLKL